MPKRNPPARQIVRRHLNGNAIALEYADSKPAHVSGESRQYFVTLTDGNSERGVGEDIDDRALELDGILF